jgi:hypothetical protein
MAANSSGAVRTFTRLQKDASDFGTILSSQRHQEMRAEFIRLGSVQKRGREWLGDRERSQAGYL